MQTEPEQWAVELWEEMYVAVYGCEPTHPAHMYGNAHRILQRAFEERERKLREALRKIQDEGDARANVIATQALKETPDAG